MRFQPKTEKQIAEENLRPAGIYSFEIADAKDKVSKTGNDMIELGIRLFDNEGNPCGYITDYLLEKLAYKLRHASVACGLLDKYELGTLTADNFTGKMGELKLIIQKDKSGQYPDKNSVADYVTKKESETHDGPPPGHPANSYSDFNDAIPI